VVAAAVLYVAGRALGGGTEVDVAS